MAILIGNNATNILTGTIFGDIIAGQGGDDTLSGSQGNDILRGGLGNDTLNGGLGIDTADYSNAVLDPTGPTGPVFTIGATAGVTVNLFNTGSQNTGGAGVDRLVSIENVFGTNCNDTITGNGTDNALSGLAGNDTLIGNGGNDTLNGGSGNDLLNGGTGNDTASYRTATAGVTVDLDVMGAQNTGGAGLDTLVNIENLIGSNFNDTLTGAFTDNNTIRGGAGNDRLIADHSTNFTLNGDTGNDELFAGPGSGTLNGGAGNDTLRAGDGSYTLNGGAGNDTLTMSTLFGGDATLNGGAGADTLEHIDPPSIGGIVTFDYNAVSDSPADAGRDTIINFIGVNGDENNEIGDRIDLTTIDANALVAGNQAFSWIGSNAFTAAGQLRYAGGLLQGNTDADAAAEFEIRLVGAPALSVGGTGSDILL